MFEIEAIVFNPITNELIERIPRRKANTFVAVWIKSLYSVFSNLSLTGVTDTTNNARTLTASQDNVRMSAPLGTTTFGIVIGNQVAPAAVTLADYKLQAQVSANIAHAAMVFALNAPDANHYQLLISRQFTNNTGSALAITEVGLYNQDPATGYFFMADRTLINIGVPNAGAVTLTYTWTVTA